MKRVILIWFFALPFIRIYAQELSWDQFSIHFDSLTDSGEYENALAYLTVYRATFPENDFELSKMEILLNEKLGKFEDNLAMFRDGHQKGYFYLLHADLPKYEPYRNFPAFRSISERDQSLREAALLTSKTIFEIEVPKDYNNGDSLPVCFIFHGGGSNLEMVKEHWHAGLLDSSLIKVYFQSYRYYDYNTYGWRSGDERAADDVVRAYKWVSEHYVVDPSRILVAGISAGATFAIDLAVRQVIPVHGILVFCPGIPEILMGEQYRSIHEFPARVFMVGGEKDYYLPRQRQLAGAFESLGVPFKYEIIKDQGHQYPVNEEYWIEKGMEYLFADDRELTTEKR